jgi:prepilin signal peptidase PulO-like enzyme (type II secretory pathway)
MLLGYLIACWAGGEQPPYQPPPLPFEREIDAPPSSPPLWEDPGATRLFIGFVIVFVALVLAASRPHPEADVEIVEAIHAEAVTARRQALWELKLLAPAILLGVFALFLMSEPAVREAMSRVLYWSPTGQWRPLWGLSTGLHGWIIGGAMGWFCRIIGTLALGKEALGMGDVHILAAAGAIAGWPVAFLAFFSAALLTLLAIVVIRLRRQSRALPYGPWLALAFLLCSIFQDRILAYFNIRWLLV